MEMERFQKESQLSLVRINKIKKTFYLGKTQVDALRGIDLEISKPGFYVLVGRSGSGKTTLLNIIGGLENPSSGTIHFCGNDISQMNEKELTKYRLEKIGFIFQSFNLITTLSLKENILLPLRLGGAKRITKDNHKYAMGLIEQVGLQNHINHKPNELSGGQRQRVAIARAMVRKPEIILADEPTANLDQSISSEILLLMSEMQAKNNKTLICASHDDVVISMANTVFRLVDGSIRN